jgi:hypothetical protein
MTSKIEDLKYKIENLKIELQNPNIGVISNEEQSELKGLEDGLKNINRD